jgi:hypothetical protein
MNIAKLKYTTKAAAEKNLKAKGVYVVTEEGLTYGTGIHAVVEIGKIVTTDGTYDEEGNELTAPIYADGYHYDIMCEQDIDFGSNSIEVNNPKHEFAGHSKVTEPLILPNEI